MEHSFNLKGDRGYFIMSANLMENFYFESTPNNENLWNVSANPQCQILYNAYMSFKDEVRKGSLGKTPQFWINYMHTV